LFFKNASNLVDEHGMDQAKKPKVLILKASEDEAWDRLAKALGFAHLETKTVQSLSSDDLASFCRDWDQVFADLSLVLPDISEPNLTLVSPKPFDRSPPREDLAAQLSKRSCLVIGGMRSSDLVRILHLYLSHKRLPGAIPLLEKGSVLLGEKIQSLVSLGALLDKLTCYLESLEDFGLRNRIPDLRQVLSGLLTKAFFHAIEAGKSYPTIDFQVGVNKGKLVVNMRFPRGTLPLEELPTLVLGGSDLFWQQIWACSDLLLLTHHRPYDELEAMILVNQEQPIPFSAFRSFLLKKTDQGSKKEDLLYPPSNFDFRLLSSIKVRGQTVLPLLSLDSAEEVDLGALPEPVLKKLTSLDEKIQTLHRSEQKKERILKALQSKNTELTKELAKAKAAAVAAKSSTETEQSVQDASGLSEALLKMEASLRAVENEKNQVSERAANEQRKLALMENKYSALYKDIAAKDKEIKDLKSTVAKLRKDDLSKMSVVSMSANEGAESKLKELESRELLLKQEVRKLAFKLDNHEKNVKAIQAESTEKSKLMEQKLQAAKAKELELLKRLDELSSALKKASKVA
jgi:hypothetical protein